MLYFAQYKCVQKRTRPIKAALPTMQLIHHFVFWLFDEIQLRMIIQPKLIPAMNAILKCAGTREKLNICAGNHTAQY